jgi:hypothetical protein
VASGKVLRYDTTATFTQASAWVSYDASNTNGAGTNKGYSGGSFDGRYVYFVPNHSPGAHGNILRYDTNAGFSQASAWVSYDASNTDGAGATKGFIGSVYDGRYLYFIPYDNGAGASGEFLRYDTTASFTLASSWVTYDASNTNGAGSNKGFEGGVFDGRYIYFVPNYNGVGMTGEVLRYDTRASFTLAGSWTSYNAGNTDGTGGNTGFVGAVFDGRYVYFSPSYNGADDGEVLRYDTTASFTAPGSWVSYDASNTDGANGTRGFQSAITDGRYIYFVPYYTGVPAGTVLRYDTSGANSSYALRLQELATSGMGGSATGPAFEVNTTGGHFAARSKTLMSSGWHLVAGVYNGSTVSLYIDGALASSTAANGSVVVNTNNLVIGAPGLSNSGLYGGLDEVQLYNTDLSAATIQSIYAAGPHGVCK